MTETLLKSLNDLPPEILEPVAEYLDLADLTSLRSVNRKCHYVISIDKFWKKYLKYTEKYFVCDLLSKSTLPGVAEVMEEISLGTVSKWLGYLKLQHIHLQNWASGETHKVVLKPSTELSSIKEAIDMVDDYNKHWLFLYDYSGFIYIWNLTGEPRELEPVSIDGYKRMTLSPQGKVLIEKVDQQGKIYMEVYKFENPEYVLTFQCKIVPSEDIIDSICQVYSQGIFEMNNMLVFYTSSVAYRKIPIVNIWDWHSGEELAVINLSNDEAYQDLKIKASFNSRISHLKFHKGSFPDAILALRNRDKLFQINIFNLKTMKITHEVDLFEIDCRDEDVHFFNYPCGMISDQIYVWMEGRHNFSSFPRFYSFTNNQIDLVFPDGVNNTIDVFEGGFWVRKSYMMNEFEDNVWGGAGCVSFQHRWPKLILTTETKIVFKTKDLVNVIDVTPSGGLKKHICRVDPCSKVIGFIEPNLLIVQVEGWYNRTLQVFNILCGQLLFSLDSELPLCVIPHYPSKIITIDQKNKFSKFFVMGLVKGY